MEIKATVLPRIVPWLALLAVAFAIGRWSGQPVRPTANTPAAEPAVSVPSPDQGASEARDVSPTSPDPVGADLDVIVASARTITQPDARTLRFFETLPEDHIESVADRILALPASAERDVLTGLLMKRWGAVEPRRALEKATSIANLPLRSNARATVYEVWGAEDAQTAFDAAVADTSQSDQPLVLGALLAGAATRHPGVAVTLWENTPERFRASSEGRNALERLAVAAHATGRRDAILAIVQTLPPTEERAILTAAIGRTWGTHEPEAATAWVRSVTAAGEMQDAIIDGIFSVHLRRDPIAAAEWAARQADERRRTNYVAAAVAEWAKYDTPGAETWVNEQPEGSYLDGATYAIATHFIERRHLPQAFAWTRRIMRNEARADLLGNLGRIWNDERPEDFQTFLAQTSLNRVELEMLRAKIVDQAPPAVGPN